MPWRDLRAIPPVDDAARAAARARQERLVKPPGSLGRLEQLAIDLAGMQAEAMPVDGPVAVVVFAADHGVTGQGVSAYPSQVTAQMVRGYLQGRAAINVLARTAGARLLVVDVGVAAELPDHPGLVRAKVRPGSRDLSLEPALTAGEVEAAVGVGSRVVDDLRAEGTRVLAVGDMGIGNTTPAAALAAAFLGCPPSRVTGRGTGIDRAARGRKVRAVEAGLARLAGARGDPWRVLAEVGGLEIAALTGAILGAASHRLPVVLDGFITAAAALVAVACAPGSRDYLIASHRSAETGHRRVLAHLGLRPLLDLGLRLGEGSGAALALQLVRAAARLHREMATFEEAGVSGKVQAGR